MLLTLDRAGNYREEIVETTYNRDETIGMKHKGKQIGIQTYSILRYSIIGN